MTSVLPGLFCPVPQTSNAFTERCNSRAGQGGESYAAARPPTAIARLTRDRAGYPHEADLQECRHPARKLNWRRCGSVMTLWRPLLMQWLLALQEFAAVWPRCRASFCSAATTAGDCRTVGWGTWQIHVARVTHVL